MKTAVLSVCSKKPLNCKFKTSPENGQPHPFHPTQLLFWTLPEQLSMLHHACVPTHPEDAPQNLRPQDFHLTHPCFELCRSSSPYYTTHVCQPWTNVPKIHHKTSDPKIFISHIPVLNFAGTALHVTPCMWANPSWANVSKQTTNFRSELFHLTHPCVELCRNSLPCYTTHVSQPIRNQRTKTHYKLQSENFHLTHPCFELCLTNSEQMTPRMCANPEPTSQRYTTKPQTLRYFAGAALHITPRMCANPSWSNVPRHTTNFNPKIFISHIPVLNFAGTTRNRLHHAFVPTLKQCCKDTPQNLRP